MRPSGRVTECKLVLLGDSNVGKSSLVLRFVKNAFNADQVTTVGAAFLQSLKGYLSNPTSMLL